jgi:hypothetical protein
MKSCPRCGNTYPDAERFCEEDGTALIAAAGGVGRGAASGGPSRGAMNRGTTLMPDDVADAAGDTPIICPVCQGKAEPGETICNFCGTQLEADTAPPQSVPRASSPPRASRQSTQSRPSGAAPGPGSARTAVTPENYIPSRGRLSTDELRGGPPDDELPYDEAPEEEPSLGRRMGRVLGYSIAAIIAVVAGGWLALHLSRGSIAPVATTSPAPAASAPTVALARNLQITVKGTDLAAALHRDQDSMRKAFEDNRDAVLDTYKRALESDNTLRDGMVVRLHVGPDGSVGAGSVMISTSPNPSLDAEVVSTMMGWKFAAAGGAPVDVDYPLVFTTNSSDVGSIEADLASKVASLGSNEAPEYASAPPVAPSPPEALATPVAAETPPPVMAALPPPEAPAVRPPRRSRPSAPEAGRMPPPPSLTERVTEALSADKRLRRVQVYANGGGMVTLTGKVFDDKAKTLAERTARRVNGVTGVINDVGTETSVWAQNESLINQRLQAEGLGGVTARVIGNGVYLDGTVKNPLDRQRAETIAVAAAPVTIRTNLIRVDSGFFGF